MATITITGYRKECNCSHCGRLLKLGVETSDGGIFGADCLVKMIAKNPKRYNGNGKPSAEGLKQLAIIATKGLEYAGRMYGYSANHFVFLAV